MTEDQRLEVMRHSTAHVMAAAVLSIFPDAKLGIGPAIANGFYYDFDLPHSLTPDDLPAIEARMSQIIAANEPFLREEVTREEARRLFAAQPYKLELIDEIPDEKVSLYRQGDFLDLWREAGWGWALWNFRGSFGILDSGRTDVAYEDFHGHKLDRKMLDLLRRS